MGRHAQSDAKKAKKGTTDPRRTEEARGKQAVSNILAFPTLKELPEPTIPLGDAGRKTFDFWCKALLENGLLTGSSVMTVENLALADQMINDAVGRGKPISAQAVSLRQSATAKLEALNVDQAIIEGQTKENRFTHSGFPARLQKERKNRGRRSKIS